MKKYVHILIGVVTIVALIFPIPVDAIGNDFDGTDWRIDLVRGYSNYDVYIEPAVYQTNYQRPGYAPDFTTAWLSVDLSNTSTVLFTQVGVQSRRGNPEFWFVYTEAGATCMRGVQVSVYTCEGNTNDLVALGQSTVFQIVQLGDGYWYCVVYGPPSFSYTIVARVNYRGSVVYDAQITAEEGYNEPTDPMLPFLFGMNHPGYSPTGAYLVDWPGSTGMCSNPLGYVEGGNGKDCLFTEFLASPSASLCPEYIGGL